MAWLFASPVTSFKSEAMIGTLHNLRGNNSHCLTQVRETCEHSMTHSGSRCNIIH